MKQRILVTALMLLLASCSNSSDKSSSNQENLSYEMSVNGCETGKHSFSSKLDLCDGLKNDSLNNFCAQSLRQQAFEQNQCPGSFGIKSTSPQTSSSPSPTVPHSTPTEPKTPAQPSTTDTSVQPPTPPKSATSDWASMFVVTSKEFSGIHDNYCQNILCLIMNLQGMVPGHSDAEVPSLIIHNYSYLIAPGVLIECTRKTDSSNAWSSKAICQMSVDPTQSSPGVAITEQSRSSVKFISVHITSRKILSLLTSATHHMMRADNDDKISVPGDDGPKEIERMALRCSFEENSLNVKSCDLNGVIDNKPM